MSNAIPEFATRFMLDLKIRDSDDKTVSYFWGGIA